MRATAFGLVVIFTGTSLGLSILETSSRAPLSSAVSTTLPTPAEKLTDKLYPKWKLANVPDLSKPTFLKKGSRVCRADGSLMISAIVGSDPHFLFQNKDCEVVDADIEVRIIDRCAGEKVQCNSLYRFQERFAVVFITLDAAPKTITLDIIMRPVLTMSAPMLWVAKSSLQN